MREEEFFGLRGGWGGFSRRGMRTASRVEEHGGGIVVSERPKRV